MYRYLYLKNLTNLLNTRGFQHQVQILIYSVNLRTNCDSVIANKQPQRTTEAAIRKFMNLLSVLGETIKTTVT